MLLEGFEVREDPSKGRGLFAARDFKRGDKLFRFDYMPIHMTNHSCDPSGSFDSEGMLVALRDIHAGEEITFHYLDHPVPASPWNFKCCCGSPNCLGWITASSL
jgi:hypothetical protein